MLSSVGIPDTLLDLYRQEMSETGGNHQDQEIKVLKSESSCSIIHIRRYPLNIDSCIKDLFDLSIEEQNKIILALNNIYQKIENSEHPAAGYEVHFKVIARGKRPIEVFLDACGERKSRECLEMPQIKGECAFCKQAESMLGYEGAKTEKAHVMKSLEGNPLTIASQHASHFFDMDLTRQQNMLATAIKVIQIYTQGNSSRYQISSHIGIQGHQTFAHAHMHAMVSLGKKESTH